MLDPKGLDVNTVRMDTQARLSAPCEVAVALGAPRDHEAAIAVWKASWSAYQAQAGQGAIPSAHEERVQQNLRRPGSFLLVARDPSGPVGISLGLVARETGGSGAPIPGLCHISLVFVMPNRWGEGIGGRLVDAVLHEAVRRGYARAQLWTHADNMRAQRLYASRGFRATGLEQDDDVGARIVQFHRDCISGRLDPDARGQAPPVPADPDR